MLKIRCSALGKIMGNARSKKETLTETCKSYIESLCKENEHLICMEFTSKYTSKGNECEKEAIKLANKVLKWGLTDEHIKGEQIAHENEYLTGHTDVLSKTVLADVKTSWNGITFPMFKKKIPNKDYYWQCMGYLALTGYDKCNLAYCLINTPEDLLLQEIKSEHYKQNPFWDGEEDDIIVHEVTSRHVFDHIKNNLRVNNFVIERNEEVIQAIYKRIEECREYYNTLIE